MLRDATYRRLRRHWQFINELRLFGEIHNLVTFGVHVYGVDGDPLFLQATSLYHPDTVERSLIHSGLGPEPGLKDPEGAWDLRPHISRIQRVDKGTLVTWHAVLESEDVPVARTRMVYTVNRSTAAVLDKLAGAPRVGSLGLQFSRGWDESIDRKKGFFDSDWGVPESWQSVILQGPHLYVATPFYKTPNATMASNKDWTQVDLENLGLDDVPATAYKPRGSRSRYDASYGRFETSAGPRSARDFYRVAWRRMAANTGERTLIPALVPPGAAHIDGVFSAADPNDPKVTVLVAAVAGSLVLDFMTRAAPKGDIRAPQFARLPTMMPASPQRPGLILRSLRLNCLTSAYADLWAACFDSRFLEDAWATGPVSATRRPLAHVSASWTPDTPLRMAADRRQALIEIDALVALALGVSADELCAIYRTQFPVLYGYDRNSYFYDANGRLVPNSVVGAWRKKCDIRAEELTATHPSSGRTYQYHPPFTPLDRERDLRAAYTEFEVRAASRH